MTIYKMLKHKIMHTKVKIHHVGIGALLALFVVIAGWINFSNMEIAQAVAPTLSEVKYTDSGAGDGRVDKIRLMFSDVITICTATVADFTYTANDITGSAIAGGTVTCAGDDLYVWINLGTAGDVGKTSHSTAPTLIYTDDVSRTISGSGGEVASFGSQNISDGTGPWPTAISMQDNSGDGIVDRAVFTYSEPLVDHAPGTLGFNATSSSNHGSCTGESADPDGTTTLTVTFTCTSVYTQVGDLSITAAGASDLHDAAGNELPYKTYTSASSPAIADGAKPILSTAATGDTNSDGSIDSLVLTFSEQIDVTDGGTDNDFTLVASTGTATITAGTYTAADTTTLTYTITSSVTGGNTSVTVTPSYATAGAGSIIDNAANEMLELETVAGTDGAKPAVLTAATGDNDSDGSIDRLVLTFSEQVDVTDGGADNDFTLVASTGTATITSGTYTVADTTTLTYTITTSTTGNTSLTVNPTYATAGTGSVIDNALNEMANSETVTGTDGAKPIIKQFTYQDVDSDGKIDTFTVTLTETVTGDSSLSAKDLILTNTGGIAMIEFGTNNTDLITTSVSSVAVTLGSEAGTANTASGISFAISTQNLFSLTDGSNTNSTLGAQSQATFADGAAPQITIFQYKDSDADGKIDSFLVTFSESVTSSSVLSASDLTFTNVGDFTGAAFGSSGLDLITSTVSSVTVTLGTEATVVDTVNAGAIAISTGGTFFTLTDGTNTNSSKVPQSQAVFADGAGPIITSAVMLDASLNDGKIDKITLTYSENLYEMPGAGTNGFVISSASHHGACGDASSDPDGTATLNVTFSCANAHTAVGDLTMTFTSNSNIADNSTNAPSAILTSSSTVPTAITDGANPILISATKGQDPISAKDGLTLVYSEPMYVDINSGPGDAAGVVDAGDTTSNESMTSTSGIGGLVNGTTLTQIGAFGTSGTVAQSAVTSNTIAISADGLTVTVTLNSVAGSYFATSGTAPSGTFTPTSSVTAPCILAQTPSATTAMQKLNPIASAPTSSGSWDLTPPSQITGFATGTTGNGNIPLVWSAITAPADFQGFNVYYSTIAGIDIGNGNGTLWSSSNDIALRTGTTATTDVTGLTVGDVYYFIIHAIDKAGNFSTASSEIHAPARIQGGYIEQSPPGIPTGIKVEAKDGKAVLTWTDPPDSDLAQVIILRGKNLSAVSGVPYSYVSAGIQTFTDTDVVPGDTITYMLRTTDYNNNGSPNTGAFTTTIPAASIQPLQGTPAQQQTQQIQKPLTTEEKKLIGEEIALLEKTIKKIDQVLSLYNAQIKKLNVNKKKNAKKISSIKSVMRRINKNKAKQVMRLRELKLKLEIQK